MPKSKRLTKKQINELAKQLVNTQSLPSDIYKSFAAPLTKTVWSNLMAQDIVTVTPMSCIDLAKERIKDSKKSLKKKKASK